MNMAGLESCMTFTNYSYDPVIDKYFAHARFYDSKTGRMLAKDPIKNNINPYLYCDNNPVNFVDPRGELPSAAVMGLIGGGIGFIWGAGSNFYEQWKSGKKIDYMDVVRSAVKGAGNGMATGLFMGGGLGIIKRAFLSYGAEFAAGLIDLNEYDGLSTAGLLRLGRDSAINTVWNAAYGGGAAKGLAKALGRAAVVSGVVLNHI